MLAQVLWLQKPFPRAPRMWRGTPCWPSHHPSCAMVCSPYVIPYRLRSNRPTESPKIKLGGYELARPLARGRINPVYVLPGWCDSGSISETPSENEDTFSPPNVRHCVSLHPDGKLFLTPSLDLTLFS